MKTAAPPLRRTTGARGRSSARGVLPNSRDGDPAAVRDGKVAEMVVYPTVKNALAAAGLGTITDKPASR